MLYLLQSHSLAYSVSLLHSLEQLAYLRNKEVFLLKKKMLLLNKLNLKKKLDVEQVEKTLFHMLNMKLVKKLVIKNTKNFVEHMVLLLKKTNTMPTSPKNSLCSQVKMTKISTINNSQNNLVS